MEEFRVQTKLVDQKQKTPLKRYNRSSQKERILPYIGQQSNTETFKTQMIDIKDYINCIQGSISSLNKQLKQKKQSLSILKKQSAAYQNGKEENQKFSYDLNIFSLYKEPQTKKRHRSQQIQISFQNKSKQSFPQQQQKQNDSDVFQSQRLKLQSIREDQLQYQDINLFQSVQRSSLLKNKSKNSYKRTSNKLQTEVESDKYIGGQLCQAAVDKGVDPLNMYLKEQNTLQNNIKSLNKDNQSENNILDLYCQKQKRIKSLSTANLFSSSKNEKDFIFDNQTILSLIKNSQIQKAHTQQRLKESVQKCNEQIRKAINQNQILNQSQYLLTESTLGATISENIFNKDLTLSEKVKLLLNKKNEQQAIELNENQMQQEQQPAQNQVNKFSLSDTQRYYYQPKLIARYQENNTYNNFEGFSSKRAKNIQTYNSNSSLSLED